MGRRNGLVHQFSAYKFDNENLNLDSGHTYESPNEPTTPREFIRRIRSDSPNDLRSPFYDTNSHMKPLARLHISRQRLYEKNCPAESGMCNESNIKFELTSVNV